MAARKHPRGFRADGKPPRTAFKPGQSGNPKGLPESVRIVREAAAKHGVTAVATLAALMRHKKPEVRNAAATALLDRMGCKPFQMEPEKLEVTTNGKPLVEFILAQVAALSVAGPAGASDPLDAARHAGQLGPGAGAPPKVEAAARPADGGAGERG